MILAGQLARLEEAGLIDVARRHPELEYLFRHALVHEAAYESLLKQERRQLHCAAGEALEQLYPDRLEELAPLLGRHYDEGHDDERAVKYFRIAAERALGRHALAEAAAHYSCALEVAARARIPVADLYRARALVYDMQGEFETARADHEAALWMARAAGDRHKEWQALLDLGMLWTSRDYTQSERYYRRGLELVREMGDPSALAQTLNRVGNWHVNSGEPTPARECHLEALGVFQELNEPRGMAETLDLLGLVELIRGSLIDSTLYFESAVELFRELDDRRGLASALATMAWRQAVWLIDTVVPATSDPAEPLRDAETAAEIACQIGWRSGEAYALASVGFCLAAQGEFGRALDALHSALAIVEDIEHRQWMVLVHCYLGRLYLDLLALPEARRHLELALALAHETRSPNWVALTTGCLAVLYVRSGELDAARKVLDAVLRADSTTETIGLRLCWSARAEQALAEGDPAAALEIVERLLAAAPYAARRGPSAIPRLSRLRGEALASLQRLDEAEAALLAAVEGATAHRMLVPLWRARVALGKFYHRQRRRDEAAEQFGEARQLIERLASHVPDHHLRACFTTGATALIPGRASTRPATRRQPSTNP